MAAETDAELILRSRDRSECFEPVFDRHMSSIHRYLRRRVGEDLAEELAAETFAQAFRVRRRFDARSATALPWLYGIAGNLVKMHRRSEERRLRAYGRAAESETQTSSSAESDARIDAAALAPVLAEALASLPPGQREVLFLHAWEGLSHEEIAEALAVSPGTVRTRLHRARRHVAKRVRRFGNEASSTTMLETRTPQ